MYNTTFKAHIEMTPYLKEGIKYAKSEATPQEQNLFLNCLKFIKSEMYMGNFSVNGSWKPHNIATDEIFINNKLYSRSDFYSERSADLGYNCCVNVLPKFIKKFYGEKTLINLKNAPNEFITNYENLKIEFENALKAAKDNLNSSIDEFVKNL